MKQLRQTFVQGLATLLPIAITLYLLYWLGTATEQILGDGMRLIFPDRYYVPGMGIAMGIVLALLTGIALKLWIGRKLLQLGERALRQVPIVKTIYSAAGDFISFWTADKSMDKRQVVLVNYRGSQIVGFVTQRDPHSIVPGLDDPHGNLIAVYLPMSYQIGGFTIYVPASEVKDIDMSVEDAMRITLTAGMSARKTGQG